MQRKQHIVSVRLRNLALEKCHELFFSHHRSVDHLAL